MPIYEYHCERGCETPVLKHRQVSERNKIAQCVDCGSWAYRSFIAPTRVWAPTRASQ